MSKTILLQVMRDFDKNYALRINQSPIEGKSLNGGNMLPFRCTAKHGRVIGTYEIPISELEQALGGTFVPSCANPSVSPKS